MYDREQLKEKAKKAVSKAAAIGPDINLDEFQKSPVDHKYLDDDEMRSLPVAEQQRLIMAGLDLTEKERGGTYFQKDTA
ncbi:MAG: SufD family Fe-S cluster assembly protein, partial [Desulfoferrobacter sp.]